MALIQRHRAGSALTRRLLHAEVLPQDDLSTVAKLQQRLGKTRYPSVDELTIRTGEIQQEPIKAGEPAQRRQNR